MVEKDRLRKNPEREEVKPPEERFEIETVEIRGGFGIDKMGREYEIIGGFRLEKHPKSQLEGEKSPAPETKP